MWIHIRDSDGSLVEMININNIDMLFIGPVYPLAERGGPDRTKPPIAFELSGWDREGRVYGIKKFPTKEEARRALQNVYDILWKQGAILTSI